MDERKLLDQDFFDKENWKNLGENQKLQFLANHVISIYGKIKDIHHSFSITERAKESQKNREESSKSSSLLNLKNNLKKKKSSK